VEIQETERRNIARELHDEASQALTSLMVGLRLLEREADSPESVVAQVAELKSRASDILENLHRLAIDLRPASLDHVGLVAALRQYINTFGQQHNQTMQFEVVGLDDKRLPPAVETNLYRIVQEALTNVVRHTKATHIDVLLERRGEQLITIIEDNGNGFDPQTAGQNGRLGLLGMRERAEMLGGTLVVESTIGTGTTIYVEVPYVHSDSNC
jgi:signal transduction histidine kinase